MTRDQLTRQIPADVLAQGVCYDAPYGVRFRTLSDNAANAFTHFAQARGFGMTARHKRANRVLVSRTDTRTRHREILLKWPVTAWETDTI